MVKWVVDVWVGGWIGEWIVSGCMFGWREGRPMIVGWIHI